MADLSPKSMLMLPPGAKQDIRKIYNLDRPERLTEAVDLLEEWVQKQTHFVKRDFSRDYLEISLISRKGSIEKTKKLLDRSCTMRTVLPKFFTKTNVKKDLQYLTTLALLLPLPNLVDDFCRVVIFNINDKEFQSHHFMEYYQYIVILCEYMKRHDYVNGFVVIMDYRKISVVELLTKMNTVDFQHIVTILIEAYGARLKKIYFLSESKTVDLLVKFVKQFLSQKLSSRVHVISNIEELPNYVPKNALPKDFGGTEKSIDTLTREWVEALSTEEHESYMQMMNKACTDESLRQIGQFNEDYMGMPGSFRHLSVD